MKGKEGRFPFYFFIFWISLLAMIVEGTRILRNGKDQLFPVVENAKHNVMKYPYPHYVFDQFLPTELFLQLKKDFPVIPPKERKLYNPYIPGKYYVYGQPKFYELMGTSGKMFFFFINNSYSLFFPLESYRQLHHYANSSAFSDWAMHLFGHFLEKGHAAGNCSIDPNKVFFEHHIQDLTESVNSQWLYDLRKKGSHLEPGHNNNRVFSRMDLIHGYPGYRSSIHQDIKNMVIGVLIFLDETKEDAGGEFAMYHGKNLVKKIKSKPNRALAHLNGWTEAIHEGLLFNDKNDPNAIRRVIQIELSAHQTVCR